MNKLTSYTIKEIHKAYHDKLLTPTSFVDLCLQKARQTSDLNAFVNITEDVAENHGIESEKRFYIDKNIKPLDGITVAIKDNFCTKNIATTCASEMLRSFVPTYDATVYARLINNGACLVGKSNLDEFAMGSGTVDSIFGPTRNSWGNNGETDWRIAGGSSGGSAVAVSSGACVAAIGSDTGGSTRNPAALCGVVGLKPTYGLVSRYGLIPLVNSMDVPGILARNVEDATRILNCIAGPDELDSTTIKREHKPVKLEDDFDLSNVKIGIPQEYHCEATINAEILSRLNVSIDGLPQKCQELLHKAATAQGVVDIDQLDPIAISLQLSHQLSQKMTDEYEILKLRQKNVELQAEMNRNARFLDGLRSELQSSRDSLAGRNPNPDSIQEHIKQMKQKVASYEESYKKAMAKFSKLAVPECEMPEKLRAQLVALETLKADEAQWRLRADDALFASRARDTFSRLRR
ncbi:unnamed protein product, partial [Iphiclides podalirius]